MEPLDFLKQKLNQGLSDVENWGSDAGNDVTHALGAVFGGNNQGSTSTLMAPQQSSPTLSTGGLQVNNPLSLQNQQQAPQQNNTLKVNLNQAQGGQPGQTNASQPAQLNTKLVNFSPSKSFIPLKNPTLAAQTVPQQGSIKTNNMPGSFNTMPNQTSKKPGGLDSFLGTLGNDTIKPLANQVKTLATSVVPASYNIAGGALTLNPTEIKQGVSQLHPVATTVRQMAQSTADIPVVGVKSIVSPRSTTNPALMNNPVSKFIFGNQPIQSLQQTGHSAGGGAKGAGAITATSASDLLTLAGLGTVGYKGVTALTHDDTPTPEAPKITDPDIKTATDNITKIAQDNNVKPTTISQKIDNLPAEEDIGKGTKTTQPEDTLTDKSGNTVSFKDFMTKTMGGEDIAQTEMFPEEPIEEDARSIYSLSRGQGIKPEEITQYDRDQARMMSSTPEKIAGKRLASLKLRVIKSRNPDAERVAQEVLKNGGGKKAAIDAYKEAAPKVSDKDASYNVSRMARESKLPISTHTPNPEDGNHSLPVAEAGDYERPSINRQIVSGLADELGKKALAAQDKLTDNDRANFQDYLEKTKPIEDAEKPDDVQAAIDASIKLTDTGNALDHEVGSTTPHTENYFPGYVDHTDPDVIAKDRLQAATDLEEEMGPKAWNNMNKDDREPLINNRMAEMQENQSFTGDNENYGGFRNQRREFTTRAERQAAGVKDLYDDPRDNIKRYVQGLKFKVGNQAYIKAARGADIGAKTPAQSTVDLGGGQNVQVSDEAYKSLKGDDVKKTGNIVTKVNRGVKQALISLGVPHAVIIPQRAFGAWVALKGDTGIRSILDGSSDLTKVDTTKPIDSDNVEFGNRIDSPLHSKRLNAGVSDISLGRKYNPLTVPKRLVYNYMLPKIHDSLLTAAKQYMDARDIDYDSAQARGIGHQINDVMGYSKNGNGFFDQATFAPSLIKSTANMYAKSFGDSNGLVARGGVAGQQLFNQAAGFISKNISNQISQSQGKPQNKSKDDFWSTVLKETLSPSIYTPFRNSKGEQVDLGIPGQYQSDVLRVPLNLQRGGNGQLKVGINNPSQMVSNATQTAKDVASPVLNAALNAVTNQTYNGTQIRNPYAPLTTQAEQTSINSVSNAMPINLQGFINQQVANHLPGPLKSSVQLNQNAGPTALRIAGNTFGLNPKADTTTGKGPSIGTYYAGQQKGQDYIAAHSNNPTTQATNEGIFSQYYARTKNNAGQTILLGPQASKANAAMLASNPTVLAGVQVAQKANGKGNYDPTFNLPTTNAPGKPSLQTYMTYESLPDGDPNRTVMEQKNPWLINTFSQQQTYFNTVNTKGNAVAGPGYVPYPAITPVASAMMTQVTALSSNQNRTPAQETQLKTLENNPDLQLAFTLLDQYTNSRRASEGLAPIPYPSQNLTAAQNALLNQESALPSGTGAKSSFIKANQDQWNQITQILADDTQYNIEKYGGVVQQGGTEPELLKDESTIGQDIAVGTNAVGQKQYVLNPALAYSGGTQGGFTFAQGSGSGGSGSSSTSNPLVPLPKIKRGKTPKMRKPPKLKGFRAPHIRKSPSKPVRVSGAHPVQVAKPTSVVKLKAA